MIAERDGGRTVDVVKANVDVLAWVLHRLNRVCAWYDRHGE